MISAFALNFSTRSGWSSAIAIQLATVALLALVLAGRVSAVCDTYKVQSGESVVSIADKLQIDYDEFLAALQSCMGYVEGSVLQVGQSVCLPPYAPACRYVSSSGECTRYTVQYGDTLSMIASSFKLDMEELANINNLNLTTPVRPNTRLVLPPAGDGCGISASTSNTPSSPSSSGSEPAKSPPSGPSPSKKDVSNSKCKMWLSSGGETIASIAKANNVGIGDLKRANGDKYPKSTDVTEPGAFVYLPPFSSKCKEEDVVVVNRPKDGEAVSISGQLVPVNAEAPSVSTETQLPSAAPVEIDAAAPAPDSSSANGTSATPINRLVVDVFLADISEAEFREREYNFRENMAYASNISVIDVDVRFSLSVKSLNTRKLLSDAPNYFKVNTALFGDEVAIYDALTSSVDFGYFPEMMDADGFDVSYMTAMYPDQVTLYDAAIDPHNTTMANQGSDPFYAPLSMWAFIGICAGGGACLILLVASLCYCRSRRKRTAAEKKSQEIKAQRQKEASKYRKIVQESTGILGGSGTGNLGKSGSTPRPSEIRIDAYSNVTSGAARLSNGNGAPNARDASVAPVGDRLNRDDTNRSFTSYLMDGSTPAETPRYSTATPRRDDNSMGQELIRRASSVTESVRETGREAIITPRLPPGATGATPRSSTRDRADRGGRLERLERLERPDRITPRGSGLNGSREYSPSRRTRSYAEF